MKSEGAGDVIGLKFKNRTRAQNRTVNSPLTDTLVSGQLYLRTAF